MEIYFTIIIIILCLLLEGFFSGSEIGVVSADQIKLRHAAAKGSKGAKLALKMLDRPEWLLSVTLVGTNISVVTNTTMVTALMIHIFGENGSWLAIVIAAPLIWIFGEIVPKSVFQQKADILTPYIIFVLRFFSYLFFPILLVFSFLTKMLAKIAGDNEKNPFTMREEIVTMLQMPAVSQGDIQPVEQGMVRRMFNFSETTVKDVMQPLIDVSAVEKGISCREAKQISSESAHIRLPVYDQRIDHIIGILHTLELLGVDPDQPITSFIRDALYVPQSTSIKDILMELRKAGTVIAIVVDEFGGAQGIVTVEDIIEEVVEDLEDEYDTYEENDHWIRKVGENDYIVNARIELEELGEKLHIELPAGHYSTLAGLFLERTRRVPEKGTIIKEQGISLVVHRSTAQAILEVRLYW
jgi:CBS domain containing-hemolysin-like protein